MTYRLLLDTSSLMYRAFFALPTSITDEDGRPVNAVRGYLDMVSRLLTTRGPDELWHVLDDDWRPQPRVDAWPGYKADRPTEPEELSHQFELLATLLSLAGETVISAPGWEADDAIGVLCARAKAGEVVDIVTGDRDLLQLVTDGTADRAAVRVLFTVKGVSELTEFDEAAVADAYGVPAARYVDYAILRGDPSDGLPGIAGVGQKTARELVARYPDLASLVDDAGSLTPRLGQRLAAAGDYLAAMREVVPVRCDVAVTTHESAEDGVALDRLAAARNVDGPVGRLRAARADAATTSGSGSGGGP